MERRCNAHNNNEGGLIVFENYPLTMDMTTLKSALYTCTCNLVFFSFYDEKKILCEVNENTLSGINNTPYKYIRHSNLFL